MIATWFVMEDGSVADPSDTAPDDKGVLRHKDGRAVAMRGDVPRSRSVEVSEHREMRPQPGGQPYVTRSGASEGSADDLSAARADYERAFNKRPFHGWDAAALRAKIAAKDESNPA